MKLNFAKETDIVVGRILYSTCVLKMGNGNYSTDITKEIVTSKPFTSKHSRIIIYKSIKSFDDMEFNSEQSLGDRNIPLNGYNHHHLFTDLESAEKYCEMFKTLQFDTLFEMGIISLDKLRRMEENREMRKSFDYLMNYY